MQTTVPAPRSGDDVLSRFGDAPLRVAALRRGYLAGEFTPADLVAEVRTRLAARGDDHVWISLTPAAELTARAADLAARHADIAALPLYGIPFAVKDNIDVAGLPTTAACPDFSYDPPADATVVRRLLDAGAICVGKTNLDQFATGLTGVRSPYGACESVFGGRLVSGGSSSGSAVAVAAGLVAFSLGTDTAGSGRVPAAMNGLVGIKPTRGLLETAGVVPACRSLDCVSLFTHDLPDAAAVFEVALGERRPRPDPAGPVRLALPTGLDFFGDEGVADAYAAAVARAVALADSTVQVDLAPFLEAGDLLYGPWVAERLADLAEFLADPAHEVLPVTRGIIAGGAAYSAVDLFRGEHRLAELKATVDELWGRADALLLPTVGTTFTIEEVAEDPLRRNLVLGRYTQFANLLDLAVVTVPNGLTADGRPASLSLIGPAGSDRILARLAAAVARPAAPAAADPPAGPSSAGASPAGTPAVSPPAAATSEVPAAGTVLAVVGRHLRGETHNHELLDRGATFLEAASTAAEYRLFRLPGGDGGLPGLVRVPKGPAGCALAVELWDVPTTELGGLLIAVPAPLSLGWVRLDDGRAVLGFLSEAAAAHGTAEDITASGGWRAYRRSVRTEYGTHRPTTTEEAGRKHGD